MQTLLNLAWMIGRSGLHSVYVQMVGPVEPGKCWLQLPLWTPMLTEAPSVPPPTRTEPLLPSSPSLSRMSSSLNARAQEFSPRLSQRFRLAILSTGNENWPAVPAIWTANGWCPTVIISSGRFGYRASINSCMLYSCVASQLQTLSEPKRPQA